MLIKDIYCKHSKNRDPFYGEYSINFKYFPFDDEKKYLTHFINDEEIANWTSDTPVFISAQTGKGKNYFIQHSLIRKVHNDNKRYERNDKILLLSNRVALNRQSKLALAELLIDLGYDKPSKTITCYTDEGIDKLFIDLDIITVCSYHQLYNRTDIRTQNFKYIICDECHFLTSDSTFYPYTNEIIKIIAHNFKNSIRIYMSATLEESFEPIMLKENDNVLNGCIYYYFQRNYDYIKTINAYDDLKQLTNLINQFPDDKWLIFVSSKSKGNSLLKELTDSNISSAFLTKDSKKANTESNEYKTYQNIVKNESFDENVLIATSVLDNGINIKDKAVKHVVIDILDRSQFIQMLGRIRINDDSTINLYIRNYSETEIETFLAKDLKSLVARLQLEIIPKDKRHDFLNSLIQQDYSSEYQLQKNKMFYLEEKGKKEKTKVKYNLCAIFKLIDRISTFLNIIYAKNPDFHIKPEKFGEFQADRRKIFDIFYTKKNSQKTNYLRKKLLFILASEEEKLNEVNWNLQALNYSFLAYIFCFQIVNYLEEQSKFLHFITSRNSYNNESESYTLDNLSYIKKEIEHYESILDIANTQYPAIDQQLRWIEHTNFDDVHFLDNQKNISQSDIDEGDILNLLDEISISQEEYEKNEKENEDYIHFKNSELLKSNGSPVSTPNKIFLKILNWFSNKDGTTYTTDSLSNVLENKPFVLNDFAYKLIKVRGDKKVQQHRFWIFVKSPHNQNE
mgnify:CR=1 FL=1